MQITYAPADSFLYSLNPMIKGFITLCVILAFSIFAQGPALMTGLLICCVVMSLIGKVPVIPIFLSLRKILVLLVVVGLIQGFSQGDFDYILALEGVLRIVGVFVAAGIFVSISSQSELMFFWEQTFRPLNLIGLPAREMALVMVIAVRFLPVILSEIDRIRMAQMARGARLGKGGFGFSAVKSLMPLMIPTLSIAIVRAGELALAMEARGYRVSNIRSRYRKFRIGILDVFAFLTSIVLVALLFGLKAGFIKGL